MQRFWNFVHISSEVGSLNSFRLLLAVTSDTRTVQQNTHKYLFSTLSNGNISFHLLSQMEVSFHPDSARGLKAILSQEEHTSQIFFFPWRYLYSIHPTCLSEIPIKPLSLGFQFLNQLDGLLCSLVLLLTVYATSLLPL